MGFMNFLKKKENQIYVNKFSKKADKIISLENKYKQMSNEELQKQTNILKERLLKGETLDEVLIEAFATVREASERILGMKHYKVQIIGGLALHEGKVAEMRTGEGKTLVGTLPAYLNALSGNGVHIVTVNEYLSKRDEEEMGKLFHFLGLTTSIVVASMSTADKREAYNSDIVYVTNTEAGFDYLRDNMVNKIEDKVQKKLNFCIVDEVDSVLLDDARTPLIISGPSDEPSNWYQLADVFARTLSDVDYVTDEETKTVNLTDDGIEKAEKIFKIDDFTNSNNVLIRFHIEKALYAHYLMKRDKDYIVRDNQLVIIDESTGRISDGRRFSNGLHQALESKEGVKIQKENQTLATITYQNFFLLYNKLSGMSGTAMTNEEEFRDIYKLQVITIPTNNPIQREDAFDVLYLTEKAKNNAIVKDVKESNEKGQPVLIGTTSIAKSEKLSELLTKEGIEHIVLNAKNHGLEANIVEKAGQIGSVTIATNIAGRGTDIKLGDGVRELGGLRVIGTERASNRRIDNQLIGRSGRQGDPGQSQFYLSFDDDLLRVFSSEQIKKRLELLGNTDEPIEMKLLIKGIHAAQQRLEGTHFEMRKSTIEYDSVNNEHRTIVYKQRDQLLDNKLDLVEHLEKIAISDIKTIIKDLIVKVNNDEENAKEILEETLKRYGVGSFNIDDYLTKQQIQLLHETIEKIVKKKSEIIRENNLENFYRNLFLQTVDNVWKEHLERLESLKDQVKFAGYKQMKPIDEYQQLAFSEFQDAMSRIRMSMVSVLIQVKENTEYQREI